jgi:hypothetical protein
MTTRRTTEYTIHFRPRARGRRRRPAHAPEPERTPPEAGRVPRLARLMALALRFEQLLRAGQVRDYAELARLGHVSRARITQIMNLLLLAPDIQEQILFLPSTRQGRDPIRLGHVQAIAAAPGWQTQRRRWAALLQRPS